MNIRYEFKNKKLFNMALTHISLANDLRIESNQRLEFLGDSVLSHIIATEIYKLYPKSDEGELTRIRAALVCEKSLASLAKELNLGKEIKFGRSEARSDGAHKDSILADTFEAVLGAVYLDSDYETVKKWTLDIFGDRLLNLNDFREQNYKSSLQIYFQKRDKGSEVVKYKLLEKSGPDHDPMFFVEAVYRDKVIGKGNGKNRKIAEQNAAKDALESLENKNEKI